MITLSTFGCIDKFLRVLFSTSVINSILLTFLLFSNVAAQNVSSNTQSIDDDWRFFRGGCLGAEQSIFDDSDWRILDLPHDWSIEDLPGTSSPFRPDAISQVNGGFTVGGTGWYRKSFTMDSVNKAKRIYIVFDGVYMNADVWINGHHLGNHPYGYTGFEYDITDQINFNARNVIAVEVKNEGVNSRWYSGSGIYRHVWLRSVNATHIDRNLTYITTPVITPTQATVHIKTDVATNGGNVTAIFECHLQHGEAIVVSTKQILTISPQTHEINFDLIILDPVLWSIVSPSLYTATIELQQEGQIINREEFTFGVRSIVIDAVQGLRINGQPLKLKGACIHHDHGPLGAASYDRAEERKVQLLKESGFNAIRSCHNPPSSALLDACDREGMLVIDESFDMWQDSKNTYDYHLYFDQWWQTDIQSMILHDRNHPSVMMWSIGNEIPERWSAKGVKTAQMLTDEVHRLDPERPVTSAVHHLADDKDPYFSVLDVAGYNYGVENYITDHQRKPDRIIVSTESYPLEAFDYWMGVKDNPWVIGDFVWAGFDYIGEASIGWLGHPQTKNFYPWNLAYCGDLDVCGWKRPQSFYRDVLWKKDQLSIFVNAPKPSFANSTIKPDWSKWYWPDVVADWNWKGFENTPLNVVVYSSCTSVELFLNGLSLGKKNTDRTTKFLATWEVPYQQGTLSAIGYRDNIEVQQASLSSVMPPAKLRVSADRSVVKANNHDLCYVTIEVTDLKGNRNPKAEILLNFNLTGPGKIIGVGNANPISTESNQQLKRKTYQGRCLVIIKSTYQKGKLNLHVASPNMSETITIKSE